MYIHTYNIYIYIYVYIHILDNVKLTKFKYPFLYQVKNINDDIKKLN